MCERCENLSEEMWAEIRDLLNYNRKIKGPMSERLEEHLESARDHGASDEDIAHLKDVLRCELIALRCACIARMIPDQEFHQLPPSIIMGIWAGTTMNAERASVLGSLMNSLFGGNEDDA